MKRHKPDHSHLEVPRSFKPAPWVCQTIGHAMSWLYAKVASGEFPAPSRFSQKDVRWDEQEVHAWMNEQLARRDRELIAEREARRKAGPQPKRKPGRPWPARPAERRPSP